MAGEVTQAGFICAFCAFCGYNYHHEHFPN